jgi:hypothetical protein
MSVYPGSLTQFITKSREFRFKIWQVIAYHAPDDLPVNFKIAVNIWIIKTRSSFNPDHIPFDIRSDKPGKRRLCEEINVPSKERFEIIRKPDEIFQRRVSFFEIDENINIALPCLFAPGT